MKRVFLLLPLFPLVLFSQELSLERMEDQRRLSLDYFAPLNIGYLAQFRGSELSVGIKFKELWLDTFLSSASGSFKTIGFNSESTDSNTAEGYYIRGSDDTFSLTQVGMGLSLDDTLVNEIFGMSKFYEYSTAYLTYNIFQDSLRSDVKYSGVGFRADYSINYRYSPVSHASLKFSYRIAPLRRSALSNRESGNDRSLLLYWPSIGFGVSYFF